MASCALSECTCLTNLTIPNSVTSIGGQAFWRCTNLTSISVDGLNPTYSSVNGVLFNKTQTTLVQYPAGIAATSYTIPNTVTSIGDGAFEYGARLTNVSIPIGVTSIGDYAFWACNSLTNITIPDSVTTIGTNAFSDCTGLTSVTIGNGVTDIRFAAFYECTNLTALHFDGNAPTLAGMCSRATTVRPSITCQVPPGWGTTFGGLPTALWTQVPTIQASPRARRLRRRRPLACGCRPAALYRCSTSGISAPLTSSVPAPTGSWTSPTCNSLNRVPTPW